VRFRLSSFRRFLDASSLSFTFETARNTELPALSNSARETRVTATSLRGYFDQSSAFVLNTEKSAFTSRKERRHREGPTSEGERESQSRSPNLDPRIPTALDRKKRQDRRKRKTNLALQKLEGSSSTGRDVRELVLGVVLGADGSRVTCEGEGTISLDEGGGKG
jgi:hypothetical protein